MAHIYKSRLSAYTPTHKWTWRISEILHKLWDVVLVRSTPEVVVSKLLLGAKLVVVEDLNDVVVVLGWGLQAFDSSLQVLSSLVGSSWLNLGAAQAGLVEPLEKCVYSVFIWEVIIFFSLLAWFIFTIASGGVFKLPIPDFLNLVDLVFAELLPAFHFLSL